MTQDLKQVKRDRNPKIGDPSGGKADHQAVGGKQRKRFFSWGFTTKITLVNTALVLFTGGITLTVAYMEFSHIRLEAAVERQKFELNTKTAVLAEQLGELRRNTLYLAGTPPIQGIIRARQNNGTDPRDGSTTKDWHDRLIQIFHQIAAVNPSYQTVRYIGKEADGQELVRIESEAGVIRPMPPRALQHKGHRLFFQAGSLLASGDVYFSDLNLRRDDHNRLHQPLTPVIRAITPIYDSNGNLFGAVAINMKMGPAFRDLRQLVQRHKNLHITDQRGELLFATDKANTFSFETGGSTRLQDLFPETTVFFKEPWSEKNLTLTTESSNGKYILNIQPIVLDKTQNRFLVCALSSEYQQMQKLTRTGRNTLLGSGLIILIIALIMGRLTAKSLTGPLRLITQSLKQYGDGEQLPQLPNHSSHEIGTLARAFNEMSDKIADRTLLLEHEIKERTEAEQSIMAGEQYLQTILDQMADGLIVMSPQCKILSVNPGVSRIFGYTPAEMMGRNVNMLMAEPLKGIHDTHIQSYLETGIRNILDRPREVTGLHKNGSEITLLLAVSEALVQHDHIFIGTLQDLTEQKQIRNDLIDARRAAEAASRAKSDFLATMSHEIRTPMNGIIGMAELLLRSELNDSQKEFTDILSNSADMLLNLLNDILDFSKVESGGMSLESRPFQLDGLLEEILDLTGHRALEKGLHITCYLDPDVPASVLGDQIRIRQILLNLINNAVKFTNKGSIMVHGSKVSETNSHVQICFKIEDTGIGIPPEQHELIFHPFTQADSSTTRKFGGTGLGLAICQRLAALMEGGIRLESTENVGSTFFVTVPFSKLEVQLSVFEPAQLKADNRLIMLSGIHPNDIEMITKITTFWGFRCQSTDSLPNFSQQSVDVPDILILPPARLKQIASLKALPNPPKLIVLEQSVSARPDTTTDLNLPLKTSRLYGSLLDTASREATNQPISTPLKIDEDKPAVLIAEDNATNSRVVGAMLEQSGYEVNVVQNGRQALDMVANHTYSLILMDCDMPVMDGFLATRHIRQTYSPESLPIVAMTANVQESNRDRCMKAGMNDFLTKPLTMDKTLKKVSFWTERAKPQR